MVRNIVYDYVTSMVLHNKRIYVLLDTRGRKFDKKMFDVYAFSNPSVSTLNLFMVLDWNVDAFEWISRYSGKKKTSNKI